MPQAQRKIFDDNELGLIAAFTRGEMPGFKFVYTLYRQQVFSYCLYYMSDRMQAEDAFQEVFIRIYTHHEQLREARALKSWVLLITRSVCLNLLRSSKFTPEFVSMGDSEDNEILGNTLDMPAMPLDVTIADDMLRIALAKIAPIYRDAFLLCEFEGYDYGEIARITNTTEANVKVRITRAKKQLRVLLAPHYQYEASQSRTSNKTARSEKKNPTRKLARTIVNEVDFGTFDDTGLHGEVFA